MANCYLPSVWWYLPTVMHPAQFRSNIPREGTLPKPLPACQSTMAHLINLLHGDEWSVDEKCFRFLDFCAFLSWPYFCWYWTKTGLVNMGKLTWILKVIIGYFHFFLFFHIGFYVANCRKLVWTLQADSQFEINSISKNTIYGGLRWTQILG
jgi:hypothetical protein